MASDQQQGTKQRKRDAVGNLRNLAEKLGVPVSREDPDLNKATFEMLCSRNALLPESLSFQDRRRLLGSRNTTSLNL